MKFRAIGLTATIILIAFASQTKANEVVKPDGLQTQISAPKASMSNTIEPVKSESELYGYWRRTGWRCISDGQLNSRDRKTFDDSSGFDTSTFGRDTNVYQIHYFPDRAWQENHNGTDCKQCKLSGKFTVSGNNPLEIGFQQVTKDPRLMDRNVLVPKTRGQGDWIRSSFFKQGKYLIERLGAGHTCDGVPGDHSGTIEWMWAPDDMS